MRAGVLGSPIAHSLSPALHTAAYRALNVDWTYTAHDVTAEALPAFVAGLDSSWAGLSLTMPLKHAVLPLLDHADDVVKATGSCNTLLTDDRRGYNTDVDGMVAALAEAGVTQVERPVVLGGGATAASAVAALAQLGALEIVAAVRDPERAGPARQAAQHLDIVSHVRDLQDPGLFAGADLVISTLPSGAADPLTAGLEGATGTLLDVVYHPWPTPLARAWTRLGGRVVAGDVMLLHQAARQVTLMTGLAAPVEEMRRDLAAEQLRRTGTARPRPA